MRWENFEKHRVPELTPEEIETLNRPMTSKEIEAVIKNLPTKQSPAQGGLLTN